MSIESQHNCPLLELPTELRLRIYELAFEDITDGIESDTTHEQRLHQDSDTRWESLSRAAQPIFVGALGLLHTSRSLRRESLDALAPRAQGVEDACSDHYKAVSEKCHEAFMSVTPPTSDLYASLRQELNAAHYWLSRIAPVCYALARVRIGVLMSK